MAEAILQQQIQQFSDFDANCAEFDALSRQLLTERDPLAFQRGIERLRQLTDELNAMRP